MAIPTHDKEVEYEDDILRVPRVPPQPGGVEEGVHNRGGYVVAVLVEDPLLLHTGRIIVEQFFFYFKIFICSVLYIVA